MVPATSNADLRILAFLPSKKRTPNHVLGCDGTYSNTVVDMSLVGYIMENMKSGMNTSLITASVLA
jgi:hypothetical protein